MAIGGSLLVLTGMAYAGVWNCELVYFDDKGYVYENWHVQQGLSRENITWAFTTTEEANWHPITWLSHLVDTTLYGPATKASDPASRWYHVTNLLLHAANVLLLYLVLWRLSGAMWLSAVTAALFAVHPLNVESVAWVAERKNLLSTFFGLAAIGAYAAYARRPGVLRYAAVLALFVLSLMSKPMLVTLPFLLLLLDFWPLGRIGGLPTAAAAAEPQPAAAARAAERKGPGRKRRDRRAERRSNRRGEPQAGGTASPQTLGWPSLVLEKLPMLAIAIVSSAITFHYQALGGSMSSLATDGLGLRLKNMFLSYCAYLRQTILPTDLGLLYPLHPDLRASDAVAAACLLAVFTAVVVWATLRGRRYLGVGWCWFLGTLVPVIGIIRVGEQARADRYMYVPMIGLLLAVVWGAADLVADVRWRRQVAALSAAVIVGVCVLLSARQVTYWRNSESIFRRTIDVTTDNVTTHSNLGNILSWQKRSEEAIEEYKAALKIQPSHADSHNNMANTLAEMGRIDEAIAQYKMAIASDPNHVDALCNLGNKYLMQARFADAIPLYEKALRIAPQSVIANCGLGDAYRLQGKVDEAAICYDRVLEANPLHGARYFYGKMLLSAGRVKEAAQCWTVGLKYAPDSIDMLNELALIRSTASKSELRDGEKALAYAQRACKITGGKNPVCLIALAGAYAELARFDEAVAIARQAVELATRQGQPALAAQLQVRQQVFEKRQPFRTTVW